MKKEGQSRPPESLSPAEERRPSIKVVAAESFPELFDT